MPRTGERSLFRELPASCIEVLGFDLPAQPKRFILGMHRRKKKGALSISLNSGPLLIPFKTVGSTKAEGSLHPLFLTSRQGTHCGVATA